MPDQLVAAVASFFFFGAGASGKHACAETRICATLGPIYIFSTSLLAAFHLPWPLHSTQNMGRKENDWPCFLRLLDSIPTSFECPKLCNQQNFKYSYNIGILRTMNYAHLCKIAFHILCNSEGQIGTDPKFENANLVSKILNHTLDL